MKDDAIVTHDVSADDQAAGDTQQTSAAKPELSERDRRLAEIYRQHNEANGIEVAAEDDAPDTDDDPTADDETPADTEQDAAEEEPGDESAPDDESAQKDPLETLGYYQKDDGQYYTKLKVNGQEREVPASQLQAYIQKDLAGDTKLQQAADRQRQLEERERALNEREQQLRQQPQQLPEQGAEERLSKAKDVLSRLYDGDEDAAAQALVEMMGQQQSLDPDQLLSEAERRAQSVYEQQEAQRRQQAWQSSVDEGQQWFAQNHSDIQQDSEEWDLINLKTERMVEAAGRGDPEFADMTPRQMIERATNEVLGWKDKRQDTSKSSTQREDRKKGLKPVPRGMSRQPAQKKPKEPDNSPQAVIARMRQSRAVN